MPHRLFIRTVFASTATTAFAALTPAVFAQQTIESAATDIARQHKAESLLPGRRGARGPIIDAMLVRVGWAKDSLLCVSQHLWGEAYGLRPRQSNLRGEVIMQLNFTVNCRIDIPSAEYSAKVVSVVNAADEDISQRFFTFCRDENLPLGSEEEIRQAAYAYGRTQNP